MKKNKYIITLWLIFHLIPLFLFIFFGRAKIETDMISLIPKVFSNNTFETPVKIFFSSSSSVINVFIETDNFDNSYKTYSEIKKYIKDNYKSVNILTDTSNSFKEILYILNKYKYNTLSYDIRKKLMEGNGIEIAEEAAMNIFSPMFTTALSSIEEDPFLITYSKGIELIDLISMGNQSLTIKDDVLYTQFDGKENIYLAFEVNSDIGGGGEYSIFMKNFLKYIDNIDKTDNGVKIYIGGVPVHSYYSQKSAECDIITISIISLLIIFILFFISFGSIKPYIGSVITILISSSFAYLFVSVIFESVHIFTFVFGTSLIGISIDYSIHYVTDYIYENDSEKSRKNVAPSIILAFITTMTGYIFLSFSSISILKTLSVFSIFGMISTILTVLLIYPIVCSRIKMGRINNKMVSAMEFSLLRYKSIGKKYKIVMAVLFVLFSLIIYFRGIKYDFSVEKLYSAPDFLIENEIAIAKRFGSYNVNDVVFVNGKNIEEVLIKEENVLEMIGDNNKNISVSKIIPSKKRQKENINLVENELYQYLDYQAETLSLDKNQKDKLLLQIKEAKNIFLDNNILKDTALNSFIESRIYETNGNYFSSIVLKDKLSEETLSKIQSVYKEDVFVLSMQEDITSSLHDAAKEALLFTMFSYIFIFIFIIFIFKKKAFVIICVQLLSLLCSAAVHSIFRIEINIFSIIALILSLGISIDYILFFMKSAVKKEIVYMSILLSMLTTILSFGTLSLSSFIPVASFGTTLFFGILFPFIFAPIVSISKG